MKRHYFINDNLDELKHAELDLLSAGLTAPQFHVLSEDEAALERLQLNPVEAVLKKDVVRGTERGAAVGLGLAAVVLLLGWVTGLAASLGWAPTVFLALVTLGFATWEGGLIGISQQNADFRRFRQDLAAGRHVLFVDCDREQVPVLQRIVARYPGMEDAGSGSATPTPVIRFRDKWHRFLQLAP
ncbi:NAD/FAD-utilizing enzyme [Seongchinamella sediminis]|uniref:NAD/FAD-utilizing enzyme n=1 Tax=Seongchinamella sediminis TaxID=2283635 RepID=A0A3L7DV89_9GAMM|nr:NAD/FAD-utilizing enzyme [Seongchinamella sediminis]RLQ21487.1 NAD/FAD-utilizing enzyme [Seongchinamella sediminis]